MIRVSVYETRPFIFCIALKNKPQVVIKSFAIIIKKQIRFEYFGKQNLKIPIFCGFECCDYRVYSLDSNA